MYEIATGQSILQTVWGEKDTALEYTLQSGEFRVGGPGGDPDFLAISVLLPTLVGVSLMFEPISRLTKGLILPVLLMTVVSLLATGSRGGLGALLLGAGILWLFTPMRHKYLLAAVAATGLVAGVVGLSLAGTASTQRYTGEAGGKSLTFRLGWTKMAILMIEDHPFVGIGTGNFPRVYNRYSVTVPEVPRKAYWTHNSFLQTWAENGVLAFIVYTGLYAIAALTMFRLIRTTTDPELRHLAVLLLSAVAGYFFFAGTSNVLENENYWIVFALVTAVSSLERERRQDGGHELGAQEPA
jgi:O-antigen ligase